MAKVRKHFDFNEIKEYLRSKTYPMLYLQEIMYLNQILEDQQNATK